jgi:hypothetical protein
MHLPATLQAYLDAWNAGDATALHALFAPDAAIVDNGNRIPDIAAWCGHQALVATAGAREVFGVPMVSGKAIVVHYILTKPNGGQVKGVDHFFLNDQGRIRMLCWTTRP